MEVIELIEEMRSVCEKLKHAGKRIRLVPTMGALHIGHASLIESAKMQRVQASNVLDNNLDNNNSTTHDERKNNNNNANLVIEQTCDLTLASASDSSSSDSSSSSDADSLEWPTKSAPPLKQTSATTTTTTTTTAHCSRHDKQQQHQSADSSTCAQVRILNSHQQQQQQSENSTNSRQRAGYNSDNSIVVIVSIFVNPKQFNNPADFVNYPNTLKKDLDLCKQYGVDYVFAPKSNEMYPAEKTCHHSLTGPASSTSSSSSIQVYPPTRFANDLEGRSRPGHFQGMLTVVCKLFNIITPDDAYFGEKDYQQLVLVEQMVRELNMNTQIQPGVTIRDHDMLPLSSRNVRLTEQQRKVAPIMYKILTDAKEALENQHLFNYENNSRDIDNLILSSMMATICLNLDEEQCKLVNVDYLELRCAKDVSQISYNQDLHAFDCQEGCVRKQMDTCLGIKVLKARLLTSIIVGETRLLDNLEVKMNLVD